jgi:hypothetical protein
VEEQAAITIQIPEVLEAQEAEEPRLMARHLLVVLSQQGHLLDQH